MTYNEIFEKAKRLGNDILLDGNGTDEIEIIYNDFEGFSDDWEEEMREFDNPQLVEEFEEWLENNATYIIEDYYEKYFFDNIKVTTSYLSFDI